MINQSEDGHEIKLEDPGESLTQWHLSYQELSDQELAALEALFQATEGSLTSFTFLDPADNLLCWSEEQSQSTWQADPFLELAGNIADPMGGTNAYSLANTSGTMQSLQQSIAAPASYCYCLSVFARSDQATGVWLNRGAETDARTIGTAWTRISSAGQLASEADSISFGIGVSPNTVVDIFGVQVEAQPAASLYKATNGTGGVYPNARLLNDAMLITTVGPSRHRCELDIVNVECL